MALWAQFITEKPLIPDTSLPSQWVSLPLGLCDAPRELVRKQEGRPGRVYGDKVSWREARIPCWTPSPLVLTSVLNESRDTGSVILICQERQPWGRKEGQWCHGRGSEARQRVHSWAWPVQPQLGRHTLCHRISVSATPWAMSLICQQGFLYYIPVSFLSSKLCSKPHSSGKPDFAFHSRTVLVPGALTSDRVGHGSMNDRDVHFYVMENCCPPHVHVTHRTLCSPANKTMMLLCLSS